MSFLGKRYKRVSSENLEELIDALKISDKAGFILRTTATFCFSKVDDTTYSFELQAGDRTIVTPFKLGEETDVERRDGTKVKVTYVLESDNVMAQTIKPPAGKTSHFRRVFSDKRCEMTITVDDCNIVGKLIYEVVE
ncbi:hypothetical protein O0L34_g18733 [Tuta absoluta]|nr:hypothetical protein O0L34_g18733 [Tuta absoluta]